MSQKHKQRRYVDFHIISDWVEPGTRVLDLGCGRGILLEYLMKKKQVFGVGVDIDSAKVANAVKRGVSVYQGDVLEFLKVFPDGYFDRVLCSRTVEELENPRATLEEGLRVGNRLTVGFINYSFWRNRVSHFLKGRRVRNEVYPDPWYERRPSNPFSLSEFETFCKDLGISVDRRVTLGADWATPVRFLPATFAGYAIYDLSRQPG
jgi:methionine biosynthesis protein MetW